MSRKIEEGKVTLYRPKRFVADDIKFALRRFGNKIWQQNLMQLGAPDLVEDDKTWQIPSLSITQLS